MNASNILVVWHPIDGEPELETATIKTNYGNRDIFRQLNFDYPSVRIFRRINNRQTMDIYNGTDIPKHIESLILYYHFLDEYETKPNDPANNKFMDLVTANSKHTAASLMEAYKRKYPQINSGDLQTFALGQLSILEFNRE